MNSAVDGTKTALEMAFDLAKSGQFTSASEIENYLAKHGFNAQQVAAGTLMRQLKELIKDAKAQNARRPGGVAAEQEASGRSTNVQQ